MSARMSHWRAVLRSYPCTTCGAGPGQPCFTSTGQVSQLEHVARQDATARCVKCGQMLDADEPGPRCDHCELVRRMVAERYTHHQRET